MTQTFLTSLTRIADFETHPYDVRALVKSTWESGDYVRTEVTGARSDLYAIETCSGEMVPAQRGDQVIGAFTSYSILLPKPLALKYRGHIVRDGRKTSMSQFAIQSQHDGYAVPTILIIGTSMSVGKTVTGRRACQPSTLLIVTRCQHFASSSRVNWSLTALSDVPPMGEV